ncbi:helix-turn-helix domain-containing protein [Ideonella sp. BN130291]|uniref:helix-turn-helix domain-containing protein n=1 Tax=Ideonella sp. BN130291 TaxID=3112940 RepID=UPI002E26A580|nr:helix-turn-helix domain-containing protein [Ideonella sp. BN130291]
MAFMTLPAPPPLRPFVDKLWDWHVAPGASFALERVLPMPMVSVIINLAEEETRAYSDDDVHTCERRPAAVLAGPQTRSIIIDTDEQVAVMGVVFQPGGAAAFLRERLDGLCDREVGLEALFGARARLLREQLLEAPAAAQRLVRLSDWLTRQVPRAGPASPVSWALAALAREPTMARVAGLAHHCGLSERRLRALFNEQVGMSPKRYARVCRFRALIGHLHGGGPVEWARLAVDAGLHDQAHLVHEFKAFAGITPSAYLARPRKDPMHVAL